MKPQLENILEELNKDKISTSLAVSQILKLLESIVPEESSNRNPESLSWDSGYNACREEMLRRMRK